MEGEIEEDVSEMEISKRVVAHCYVTVGYAVSLRAPERLLLDLDGLNKHWREIEDRDLCGYMLEGADQGGWRESHQPREHKEDD